MSGISPTGRHGGYFGPGREQGRSASLVRFCRGRKTGDVVSGVYLRDETDSLGWALLEGEELLAHLPAHGQRPQVGERVFFRIEALAPEVVLRMLAGTTAPARLAALFPSLPLAQEAGLYIAARDKFDALLAMRRAGDGQPESIRDRCAAFAREVVTAPVLLAAFTETLARSRALSHAAAPAGLAFFRHMPWLSRAVTGIEVSFWNRGEASVFAGATLVSGNRVLLRGRIVGGALHYRIEVLPAMDGKPYLLPEGFAPTGCQGEYMEVESLGCKDFVGAGDLVGCILALAVESSSIPVERFSRRL